MSKTAKAPERGFHPAHAKEAFTKDALERVAHTIADVEHSTHAEIRISVRDIREGSEVGLPINELALKEFATLRMHETKGRVGVLLFILYDERKFYVIGDEGVHSKVNPETWNDVAAALRDNFKKGMFEQGLHDALHKIEHHLKGVLPARDDAGNELSNDVMVR